MAANDWRFDKTAQRAARRAFAETGAGALRRTVHLARQQYTAGARSGLPSTKQLTSIFRMGGVKGFLEMVGGGRTGAGRTLQAIERYARNPVGRQLIAEVLRELGPVGAVLGSIIGHGKKELGTLPSDLRYAIEFVKAFSDQPAVLNALARILQGRGAQVVFPGQPGATTGASAGQLGQAIAAAVDQAARGKGGAGMSGGGTSGTGGGGRGRGRGGEGGGTGDEPPPGSSGGSGGDGRVEVNVDGENVKLPRNHPLVTGEMIETPESSNVFAFGFDNQTHSLFVRFKEQQRKGDTAGGFSIGSVFGASGRGRPHKAGALYLYHHVPARLFLGFIDAGSKGDFVWDNLRIRGTVSGHRFDYALVGVQGAYVPRKATLTPLGESYIPRSIFTDRGRSLSSPLPEQLVRPLRPLGRPPNSGRNGLGD